MKSAVRGRSTSATLNPGGGSCQFTNCSKEQFVKRVSLVPGRRLIFSYKQSLTGIGELLDEALLCEARRVSSLLLSGVVGDAGRVLPAL